MRATTQNYNMANSKCEKQFEILLLLLLLTKPSSPSTKPPTTHCILLTISSNYTDNKINATQ
jgi:hypothetical protein